MGDVWVIKWRRSLGCDIGVQVTTVAGGNFERTRQPVGALFGCR